MPSIKACQYQLASLGWTVDESAAPNTHGADYWQVTCSRGEKTILVLAPTREDAWERAYMTVAGNP